MKTKRSTYHSYGNEFKSEANLCFPKNVEELKEILLFCKRENRKITPAGSFHSFDRQNSGNDIVIGFEHFNSIVYNQTNHTIKVGPGATWGAILDLAYENKSVLYTCITCSKPTAGGTLSVNTQSMWAPSVGKEGTHCLELEVMTTEGELLTCSREKNQDLFFGVISGFGMLGFITSITYKVFHIGQDFEIAIDTIPYDNIDDLEQKFDLREAPKLDHLEAIKSQSSLFYIDKGQPKFIIYNRQYRPIEQAHKASKFQFGQAVLANGVIRFFPSIINYILKKETKRTPNKQWLIQGLNAITPGTFWAEPDHYWTTRCSPFFRPLGYKSHMHQMIHFIPMGDEKVTRFTKKAYELLDKYRLKCFMFDIKYIPKDEPFVLSSSRYSDGFYINTTFMDYANKMAIVAFYDELNELTYEMGGKVSLSKNCFIKSDLLEKMLQTEMEEFMQLKGKYDPNFMLISNFFASHFPSYFGAQKDRTVI